MKDELDGKNMKECTGLRAKTYSYFTDNTNEDKKKQKKQKRVS